MNSIEVHDLRKSYRRGLIPQRTEILKGLSFSVQPGTVTGFLGANGAGKTTTMRCMLGLDHADSGSVLFFGKPLDIESRRRIGFLPERPYFYEHLSGVEFLTFYANLTSSWKKSDLNARILQILKRVDLEFAKDRLLRNYSKGMLQKVGLAQALIHDPEVIILDEPMSGLDPDGRMALAEIIVETARRGPAVFFSSHLMHDTERLCQQLVVIKNGVCIFTGSTESLLERGGVQHEIHFLNGGEKAAQVVPKVEELQGELKKLINQGATITEVRRLRPSLEEIFVSIALRGPR